MRGAEQGSDRARAVVVRHDRSCVAARAAERGCEAGDDIAPLHIAAHST
jgi:hypothetical protein